MKKIKKNKIISFAAAVFLTIGLFSAFPGVPVFADDPENRCGDNNSVVWTLDENGLFQIKGSGKMWDWASDSDVGWYARRNDIKTVKISSGVTNIGNNAFKGCVNLIEINMPAITIIGNNAFSNCKKLDNIDIKNVTVIEEYAFSDCSRLKAVVLTNAEGIGEGAFSGCENLTDISMPNMKIIGKGAFLDCTGLTGVIIPPGVTKIEDKAFSGCENLKNVIFEGNDPVIIGSGVFSGANEALTVYFYGDPPDWADSLGGCATEPIGEQSDEIEITASAGSGWAGGKNIPFEVFVEGSTKITSYNLTVEYDPSVFSYAGKKDGIMPIDKLDAGEAGKITISGSGEYGGGSGGVLFTLYFDIKESAQNGKYEIKLNYLKYSDIKKNGIPVNPKITNGGITVAQISRGDANGDNTVDISDLVRLARHIAEIAPITEQGPLKAADVTGDGKITVADLIRLARYLAGIDTAPLGI